MAQYKANIADVTFSKGTDEEIEREVYHINSYLKAQDIGAECRKTGKYTLSIFSNGKGITGPQIGGLAAEVNSTLLVTMNGAVAHFTYHKIEGEPAHGQAESPPAFESMEAGLMEAFYQTEVPHAARVIEELDAGIASVMHDYRIKQEEVYRRVAEGALELEKMPGYKAAAARREKALELKGRAACDADIAGFLRMEDVESSIRGIDLLGAEHEKSRDIASALAKPRQVRCLLTQSTEELKSLVDLYVPVRYSEKATSRSPTESGIVSLADDVLTDVIQSSEGSDFDVGNWLGITKYRIEMRSEGEKQRDAKDATGLLTGMISTQQKSRPLYSLGLVVKVSQLLDS
ncbi:MAG: hypothetical protein HY367_02905 [Candidatus Aenigmarchaeota archaeon]|nr:hypothetical protein [Candidatus Aenigmarchaeota archaeon]